MASVFKRTYRNQRGKLADTARYYVDFADQRGDYKRLPAFVDKGASEELGRRLVKLASARALGERPGAAETRWLEELPAGIRERLARWGLLDGLRVAAARTVQEHVGDFKQALRDRGNTEKHAALVAQRVGTVAHGIGAKHAADLTAAAVARYLAGRRGLPRSHKGISAQSSNHYLRAVKSFGAWLVRERRAAENPVAHLSMVNVAEDRRHVRRALEADELLTLLTQTAKEPQRYGMAGDARALLYRLVCETGLRANEARSLTKASFHLDADSPYVVIEAGYSKRRRNDELPLRAELVGELRAYLTPKLPQALAFAMPHKNRVVEMLRADLGAARAARIGDAKTDAERSKRGESSFLSDRDAAGRVLDFHSLRATFASMLAASGCHPKTAQELMRHSTITLTMDLYTHTARGALGGALAKLPDLTVRPDAARATGTDSAVATPDAMKSAGSPTGRNGMRLGGISVRDGAGEARRSELDDAHVSSGNERELRRTAVNESEQAAAGFEPANDGFANRSPDSLTSADTSTCAREPNALAVPLAKPLQKNAELQAVVAAWPGLAEHLKAAILAIVQAGAGGSCRPAGGANSDTASGPGVGR